MRRRWRKPKGAKREERRSRGEPPNSCGACGEASGGEGGAGGSPFALAAVRLAAGAGPRAGAGGERGCLTAPSSVSRPRTQCPV
eukprot:6198240-Pleurochrysis_carterae.AAC.2